MAPRTEELDLDRVWIGMTPERSHYDPSFDAGLAIEILPAEPFASAFRRPRATRELQPGELIRIESRLMLVRHLDEGLRQLSLYLDLEPTGQIEHVVREGYRRAVISFALPNSASLELIEPVDWDSPAGRYLATWGPGPYHTRIATQDLAAKRELLTSRGFAYKALEPSTVGGRDRILLAPALVGGALFELVDAS
jgi:hypothetical protein